MAIVEMSKLNLAAMSYDRDVILNALQRTRSVEIKSHSEVENTVNLVVESGSIRAYLTDAENALSRLLAATDEYVRQNRIKTDVLKDGFNVSYGEFMSAKDKAADMDKLVAEINELFDEKKSLNAQLNKICRDLQTAEIYSRLNINLHTIETRNVIFRLGVLPSQTVESFFSAFADELCSFERLCAYGDETAVFVAYHKSVSSEAEKALQNSGFSECPFKVNRSGKEFYADLKGEEARLNSLIAENAEKTYLKSGELRDLKTYCDFLAFELEKAELSDKMRATQTTFLLEAYVPKEAEEAVKKELDDARVTVYYEFSQPDKDEVPPTLLKNNKVVKNFEAVTNMYSAVNYKEFDPNTVMGLFYSIFLGFIMGDVGYGLLMLVLGGFVYFKITRDCGMKRLAGVFAIGGIFAVIWGFLFNSLFGIQLPFIYTVMPNAQSDMWTLMGIKIPAVLIISLIIGTVQLCVGYVCRAVQCWRRKRIADGILDGLVWAVFTFGVGLAIVGLIDDFNLPYLAYAGGIIAAAMLLCAILTAGRGEKLLGKFTKGFSAAYGVINFASDVLSYARLYGLMLSGAVIAQIVSSYSLDFFASGNAGLIILGAALMLIGHAFNLAIGLLGAYIHDARLQYVEFYGRFYEGEGELFAPLGSKHKYIYLEN